MFSIIVSPQGGGGGAFSRDFTTSLAPECRAFSGALKIEKLKAPLIPGPEGAVDTNDWCINRTFFKKAPVSVPNIFFYYFKYLYGRLRECHNEIT